MAIRYDSGRFSRVTSTPQGGIRVEAAVSRTGILTYRADGGASRRELRLPEDVFHADSLASLKGAPATHMHPGGMVGPASFRSVAVGYMGDDVRQDGDKVVGHMAIQDADMVSKIEAGTLRELSAGYTCRLDETPGEWEGQRYDAVQRDIRYNHVALLPPGAGRSGSEVSLRLDSAGDCIAPKAWIPEGKNMKIEIIDGTEYEAGTDAHKKAVTERADVADKASALEARADAAEAEVQTLKERADGEGARVSEAVAGRLALHRDAVKAGVEIKADADDASIRAAVVGKVLPGLDLEGKDEAYLAASFDLAMAKIGESAAGELRKDALSASRDDAASKAPAIGAGEAARLAMVARNAAKWQTSVGTLKAPAK